MDIFLNLGSDQDQNFEAFKESSVFNLFSSLQGDLILFKHRYKTSGEFYRISHKRFSFSYIKVILKKQQQIFKVLNERLCGIFTYS